VYGDPEEVRRSGVGRRGTQAAVAVPKLGGICQFINTEKRSGGALFGKLANDLRGRKAD
jgi:hypothetical protein